MLKLKFVLVFKHRKVVANVTLQLYFEINFDTIFGTSFGKTNINQHVGTKLSVDQTYHQFSYERFMYTLDTCTLSQ